MKHRKLIYSLTYTSILLTLLYISVIYRSLGPLDYGIYEPSVYNFILALFLIDNCILIILSLILAIRFLYHQIISHTINLHDIGEGLLGVLPFLLLCFLTRGELIDFLLLPLDILFHVLVN